MLCIRLVLIGDKVDMEVWFGMVFGEDVSDVLCEVWVLCLVY